MGSDCRNYCKSIVIVIAIVIVITIIIVIAAVYMFGTESVKASVPLSCGW